MPTQTIIWTALPSGIAGAEKGRRLKLSVLVSPRLRATAAEGERLSLWPDFLDWPARMQTATFKVQFAGGPTLDATFDKSKLESSLWRAVFNPDTFVRAHVFDDYVGRTVISYPARHVYDALKRSYQFNGIGHDSSGSIGGPAEYQGWEISWNAALEAETRANLDNPNEDERDAARRLLLFHRRPQEAPVQLPQDPAGHEYTLDFHTAVSALGDYPALLRSLGLVLDLEVPAADVPETVSTVQVLPSFTPATGTLTRINRSPKTAVRLDATRFQAASNTDEIIDGLLTLNEAQYALIPVDLDGASLKLVNAAGNANRAGDPPREERVPALRSAGIALTQDRLAPATKSLFGRAQANNAAIEAGGEVTLFADDLVRGLRVDVWEERTGTWRSLCRRVGTYVFETANVTRTIEDEGFVQPAVTEAANPGPGAPNDLYLHEALAHWEGWSLAARRPGRAGGAGGDAAPEEPDNATLTPFKLRVDFTAARGSLPGLRFGRRYRMRARVADLAGNSVALEAAPDLGLPAAPRAFAYLRYEPVAPPDLVPRDPIEQPAKPGESIDRLVLRTANTDPSKDGVPSAATSERHVAPPRSSVPLAETHGAVDGPAGTPRADLYARLKAKDAGQLPLDPATGRPVEPGPQLALPYLADPLSRGPALRGLPGAPPDTLGRIDASGKLVYQPVEDLDIGSASATLLDWGVNPTWPDLQPFRLVVRDGTAAPAWDRAARVLTVFLPKGTTAEVPLSSYLNEDDLELMGVWEWLREATERRMNSLFETLSPIAPNGVDRLARSLGRATQLALEGGQSLLTPARRLVLVHAVQQPLGRPVWRRLVASRGTGATRATFDGELQIHRATTARVAFQARWAEPVDRLNEDGPRLQQNEAVIVDLALPGLDEQPAQGQAEIPLLSGAVTVARYNPETDRVRFVPGATPQHVLGDTKYRQIRYLAAGASRFREFFPPDARGGFARESDEIVIDLPSTARPAPPRVLYAVPTFGWERQADTNLITSQRKGNAIRFYLDRPWFSSGAGEQLGVVFAQGALDDARREKLRAFVTQAGSDSAVLSTVENVLFNSDVPSVQNLALDGLPASEKVNVVPFDVQFDPARRLWYCDVEFRTPISSSNAIGAYNPFIRFALARYQPNALPGLELSRAVVADFIQPTPDRHVIATFDPYDRAKVRLAVAGYTYRAKADVFGQQQADGPTIEIGVETRRPDIDGELGWEPVAPGVATIVAEGVREQETLLWIGRITLPADRAPGQFRIVIREFEHWHDDASAASSGGPNPAQRAARLIYAESLEV